MGMIADEQTATVVRMAMEIEDHTPVERRALLAIAHRVDRRLNRQTLSNPRADHYFEHPSHLAREIGCGDKACRVCTRDPNRSLGDDE
jgi:hypothetical protein